MKVICIIQARYNSTRLPGKVLKIVKDKSLLWYAVERIKQSKLIDRVVIAISDSKSDVKIVNECDKFGWDYFVGSENDVLDRFYKCLEGYVIDDNDIVVRVTSDCPLIDSNIIDDVIQHYKNNTYDIVKNTWFYNAYPSGFDCEIYSAKLIREYWQLEKDLKYREHVIGDQSLYNVKYYANIKKSLLDSLDFDINMVHLSVDTYDDFVVIEKILNNFNDITFTFEDVINFLNENINLVKHNLSDDRLSLISKHKKNNTGII